MKAVGWCVQALVRVDETGKKRSVQAKVYHHGLWNKVWGEGGRRTEGFIETLMRGRESVAKAWRGQ